jgi:Domain of unknown function (DUF4382)/Domain of unknown function (DUF5666)
MHLLTSRKSGCTVEEIIGMKHFGLTTALALAAVVSIAGCGGGGGGTTSGGTGRLQAFAADDFRDDHQQIWATIYKVELLDATGAAVTVFDDAVGKSMDLQQLHDNAGPRFAFLSDVAIAVGTYTQVRLTMGPEITRFPVGSTTGIKTPFAASLTRNAAGNVLYTSTLDTPTVIAEGVTSKLIIDFDLPHFVLANGEVTPKVKRGDDSTLSDKSRHHDEDYHGTISGLSGTAPVQSFTLSNGAWKTEVSVDATTVVFYEKSQSSPALSNNLFVEVNGVFDSVTGVLKATKIKIEDKSTGGQSNGRGIPEVKGLVSAPSTATRSFTIAVSESDDFVPTQSTVNVVVTDTTVFRAHRGVLLTEAEYFAGLGVTSIAEVKGSYNAATNTLTATLVKSESESESDDDSNEAEAKGTAISIDATAGTFTLSPISEYEGFFPGASTLNVVVAAGAEFEDDRGKDTDRATFFSGLSSASRVTVKGSFAGGVFTAVELRLK